MSGLQYSLGLQLDAGEAVRTILGAGPTIYNFLTKSGLQPATLVYGTDVSANAGDSDGWHKTLESIAAVSRNRIALTYALMYEYYMSTI